ncbi:MAG TPA: response regulator [Noviherbaspirillum sp.]|nr:response regulator [Noviherbaspirillum sp.]
MAGKRVLVIEDDPANLRLMVILLKSAGHEVTGALDGEAGLAIALRDMPDLVLCDGRMPMLSGFEVVRQLRADPATAGIPVVAVTGLVRDEGGELAEAGFNGVISKPFDIKTFARDVGRFLE